MGRFTLLGHDCPYRSYPAPVIPIVSDGEVLFAVYPSGPLGKPTLDRISPGSHYVSHDEVMQDFDYERHRLFAIESNRVHTYTVETEDEYLTSFLSGPHSERMNAFLRLTIAKQSGRRNVIVSEIERCHAHLMGTSPGSADAWREREMRSLDKAVFLAPSNVAGHSRLVEIVKRVIRQSGGVFLLAPSSDTSKAPAYAATIPQTSALVAVFEPVVDGCGPDPNVIYALGYASGLIKPALIVTADPHSFPEVKTLLYDRQDIEDEAAVHRFERKLADALANLVTAQTSARPATVDDDVVRRCAEQVLQFAGDISKQAQLMKRPLREMSSIVTLQASDSGFAEKWEEFETFHLQWISHCLNGPSSKAQRALGMLEAPWGSVHNALANEFKYLQRCAESYQVAFGNAQKRVQEGYKDPVELASVVEPLDQTLSNLTIGANKVIEELAAAMLKPQTSSD